MPRTRRLAPAFSIVAIMIVTTTPSTTWAQSISARSLGGYGAGTNFASGLGMRGSIIPFAGGFGGFMPYRMGGGSSLSFQPRAGSPAGERRSSFTLTPMSRGMSPMPGTVVTGSLGIPRLGTSDPMGKAGGSPMGNGLPSLSGSRGMGVMPPSLGYPFRQPPSLISPASTGPAMSM